MVRVKNAISRANVTSGDNTNRLPLALKPSNTNMSPAPNQTLSPVTNNYDPILTSSSINQPLSSTSASSTEVVNASTRQSHVTKETISSSTVTKDAIYEENDDDVQYDLATCINESGGPDKFLQMPCMVLYKKKLTSQVDLEKYILDTLSSYDSNKCLFPGVKGSDAVKQKINQFYIKNRRKSKNSIILFKANATKTTLTQQILLQNDNLYLYVDEVLKKKTSRNKKQRILIEAENINTNDDGLVNNTSAGFCEEYENEEKDDVDEDEAAEETLSPKINKSTVNKRKRLINRKGGSKNCGLYRFYHKKEEVKECVNNVLCYAREHGVLMNAVQLKALFDIQNVEITKDRANSVVQLITESVDIVSNPHYVAPIAQQRVYEYYGEKFKLSAITPTKLIPIPREIMEKYKQRKVENVKSVRDANYEKQQATEIVHSDDLQTNNGDDSDQIVAINHENLTENNKDSIDNLQAEKASTKSTDQNKEKNKNDKEKIVLADDGMIGVESDLDENNLVDSNNDLVTITEKPEAHTQDTNARCTSPAIGETNSSFTLNSKIRLSSTSSTCSESSPPSKLSTLTSSLEDVIPKFNSTPPIDILQSSPTQHPIAFDNVTKTSTPKDSLTSTVNHETSLLQQGQITPLPPQRKKNVVGKEIASNQKTPMEHDRRSFGLRSKAKKKKRRSSTITASKDNQDEHADAAASTIPMKKKKLDSRETITANYQKLTQTVGKIKKTTKA